MMYNEFQPSPYVPAQYRGVRRMPEQDTDITPQRGLLDYVNTGLSAGSLGATKVGGGTVAGHLAGGISGGATMLANGLSTGIGTAVSGAGQGLSALGFSSLGGSTNLLGAALATSPIGWAALGAGALYGLGRTKFGKKIGRNISKAVGWKPPSQWF